MIARWIAGLMAGVMAIAGLCGAAAPDPNQPAPSWPQKGDVIFVAATFQKVSGQPGMFGSAGYQQSDVPACTQLKVTKPQPEKSTWAVQDLAGGFERLKGPWLTRMHREVGACREQMERDGQPWVVADAFWVYRLVVVPPDPNSSAIDRPAP